MFNYFYKRRLFFSIVATVVCFFAIIISQTGSQRVNYLIGSFIRSLSNPLFQTYNTVTDSIATVWSGYIYLINLSTENKELKRQVEDLTEKVSLLREMELEYSALVKDLGFAALNSFNSVYAEIIYDIPKEYSKILIINKGSEDGVSKDDGIISPDGAVGRVIAVDKSSSTVQLINDTRTNYPVILQRTREKAMLTGSSGGELKLYFVPRAVELEVGDVIVTSGQAGIFPKGITVGSVSSISKKDFGLFQETTVKPAVEFSKLERVFVVRSPNKTAIESYRNPSAEQAKN